ncbi:MAG: efflux RND transporter periplasmic adaptor subunit [Chloroflexi bacterium]|nr:efflux RND transporter periplasmic adaptor subunit [Chloroflexota bacterium]
MNHSGAATGLLSTTTAEARRPAAFRRPGLPRVRLLLPAAALLAMLALGYAVLAGQIVPLSPAPAPVPSVASPATTSRITARGKIAPVARASIGTLAGGIVQQLLVEAGDSVSEQEEVARVKGVDGSIEVVTAPWRGTVVALPARRGDTVLPGATLAVLGDLRRLQVETTDVDEYIIDRVSRGQEVTMIVEALDRAQMEGRVRTVALQPEKNEDGDDHYPVVIDIRSAPADPRLGMTVRITFAE